MVFQTSLRWIYCGQYTPTDFLVCLLAVAEKGRTARVEASGGDRRIGRKARFVDFEPPWFFPRPFPFVVAFSCGCRHYGRSSVVAAPAPPYRSRNAKWGSLNLDPYFDGTPPDNGFRDALTFGRFPYRVLWFSVDLTPKRTTKASIKRRPAGDG